MAKSTHRFHKIFSIYNIRKLIKERSELPQDIINENIKNNPSFIVDTPIEYSITIKLDGTNGCIKFSNSGGIECQSKNQDLSEKLTHMGFYNFMSDNSDRLIDFKAFIIKKLNIKNYDWIYVFGEWGGDGIQGRTAFSKIDFKHFVVFDVAILVNNKLKYLDFTHPFNDKFEDVKLYSIFDVESYSITVDYSSHEAMENTAKELELLVSNIEKECPWGKKFGILGIGEGIVCRPKGKYFNDRELMFKVKGDLHKTQKSFRKVAIDAQKLSTVLEFVNFSVTENRLNQGFQETKNKYNLKSLTKKQVGYFIKWVSKDIKAECKDDLQKSDLKWKDVSGEIAKKSKEFFVNSIE